MNIARIISVHIKHAHGTASMGDVTDEATNARFSLDVPWWTILSVRGDCISGSSYADCIMYLDSGRQSRYLVDVADGVTAKETPHNHRLFTFKDFGTGGDPINWRIPDQAIQTGQWVFTKEDEIVFEWAKASMEWALRVVLGEVAWEVPVASD